MKVTVTHLKNPAIGWDITVQAEAEAKERIVTMRVVINQFPEPDDILNPPANSYDRTYIQKGVYPGENSVVATATDQDGNDTIRVHKWSS